MRGIRTRFQSVAKVAGRVVVLAIVSMIAVIGMSSFAHAKGEYHFWNTSSNPLTVTGYGSTGYAYGDWRIADTSNGTRSILRSRLKYNDADNHKVYVQWETWTNAGYCAQPDYTSCDQAYYYWAMDETSHQNEESWTWHSDSTSLNPAADYARARIAVRLDIPWRPDPISGWVLTRGSNY